MSAKKASVKKLSAKKKVTRKKSMAKKKLPAKRAAKRKAPKKKAPVKATAKKRGAAKASKQKRPTKKKISVKKPAAKRTASAKVSKPAVTLHVGDLAPHFSLLNQNGQTISLSDFAGKQNVVLYFYPKAMTPGCTVQACGIRDHADAFRQVNAVVLGVSPDKVSDLVKFREHDQLNFDLLSDEDTSLAKRYGVWGLKKFMGREFMGVRRWTFIIGKDGKIKHIMNDVNTQTHHDDVLAILKTL